MKFQLTIALVLFSFISFGQSKVRLPLWTFNTKNTKVFGLAVGYTTTKRIENVSTNGLRFELLGLGILLPMMPDVPIAQSDTAHERILKRPITERVNGINLSPIGIGCNCKVNGLNIYGAGSMTREVNGISASILMNITEVHKGLQASFYFNFTYNLTGIQAAFIGNRNFGTLKGLQISAMNEANDLRGIQIGIYNKTNKMKGLQIGLWNVNGKRKRPILNF